MWRILQHPEPDDFVIHATGESHSVREFLDLAAARCEWIGRGVWKRTRVISAPLRWRVSQGDASKAREKPRVAAAR